jgi:hypothetical protein
MDQYSVGGQMSSEETIAEVEEEFRDEYCLCPFCSDEIISDDKLLEFAIECLDTTKQELINKYLESKNE